jgi:hypothetical protein
MKRFIKFLTCFILLLSVPIFIFGQESDSSHVFDLSGYVINFATFSASIITITSLVNKLFKLTGFHKQYLSWLISLIIGYAAFFLKLGIFGGIEWHAVLIYVILFALGSNGLFDWQLVKSILLKLGLESTVPGELNKNVPKKN